MTSIPSQNKALVLHNARTVVEDGTPIPPLAANEILVQTKAGAINPTEWKHIDEDGGADGAIIGCDGAGIVVAVGCAVPNIKVGDVQFYFVSGISKYTPLKGAIANYALLKEWNAFKAPVKLSMGSGTRFRTF